MKSYIQGLITGGVFVFAFMVIIGAEDYDHEPRYTYHSHKGFRHDKDAIAHVVFDTYQGMGIAEVWNDDDRHIVQVHQKYMHNMMNEPVSK